MENTNSPIKQKWWFYLLPMACGLFGSMPARIWKIPLIASYLLVTALVFIVWYWLFPGPKKISFLKYLGVLLLMITALGAVLWGIPITLSWYISGGWAFGLTWFVTLQGIYWFLYRFNPRNRKLTTGILLSPAGWVKTLAFQATASAGFGA